MDWTFISKAAVIQLYGWMPLLMYFEALFFLNVRNVRKNAVTHTIQDFLNFFRFVREGLVHRVYGCLLKYLKLWKAP